MFTKLKYLHLSYNKIPTENLCQLGLLPNLVILNLASNDLCSLPPDLSFFESLEELNLDSNKFSSTFGAPIAIFDSLATIPRLKKLNLSRNRLEGWYSQLPFPYLQELYFAFN